MYIMIVAMLAVVSFVLSTVAYFQITSMWAVLESQDRQLNEHREALPSIKSIISDRVEHYIKVHVVSQQQFLELDEKFQTFEDEAFTEQTVQEMIDKEVSKEVQRYIEEECVTDHEERIDAVEYKLDKICSAIRCLGSDLDES